MSDQRQALRFLIYQAEDGAIKIEVRFEDETVWLSQPLMAELFGTTQRNVSLHLQDIYEEGELQPAATHKEYLSARREGARDVQLPAPKDEDLAKASSKPSTWTAVASRRRR